MKDLQRSQATVSQTGGLQLTQFLSFGIKKNAQGHPFRYELALLFKKKFVFVVAGKNLSILVQIQQRHVAAATKRAALLLQGSQIKERHHSKTKCIFQKE